MLRWLRRWRERDDEHLIRLTSYAESSMKLKIATPKTNAGYIVQRSAIVTRPFDGGGPIAG